MTKLNSKYKGFNLKKEQFIEEEASTVYLYEHEKTKAQIVYMKNEDPNKVFFINFRTPPIGSTGNCHILEHCVLNGSRKYKTKEPFMDLIKSSLHTYLNAMTYPDKTVFPVASRNNTDFSNLMDLYLDAVFHPNVINDPLIFRQEGWRYEIFDKSEPLTYQGVVYNEMKGALSSADDQVENQIFHQLFPNTIYAENSGGNPEKIPTLSFEEFRNFHIEFYHPSNSRTFLYGNIDEEECFNRLDEYFNEYEYKEINSMPVGPEKFTKPKNLSLKFSVGSSDDIEDKAFLSESFLIDKARTDKYSYLISMLPELIINSEASPLRQELLQELNCEDVYASIYGVKEIGFSIIAKNCNENLKDTFHAIIEKHLKNYAANGFDEDLIKSEFNDMEYKIREKGGYHTKGLILGLAMLNDWNYDLDPIASIMYRKKIEELEKDSENGIFEEYIKEHFINNPHKVSITHLPVRGLNAKKEILLAERLKEIKSKMSDSELDKLIGENTALRERQNSTDSDEAKSTIPVLSAEELPKSLPKIPRKIVNDGTQTWLYHNLPTSGIQYLDFAFSIDHISEDNLPYVTIVSELIGMLDSKNYTYSDYAKKEGLYCGGITTTPRLFRNDKNRNDFRRTIIVSTKTLGTKHLEKTLDLIVEQINNTLFEDSKRIIEVLKMMLAQFQMEIVQNGHQLVMERSLSGISALSRFNQKINGVDYYLFLKDFVESYSEEKKEKLREIYSKLFTTNNLVINITAEEKDFSTMREIISKGLLKLPSTKCTSSAISLHRTQLKEAYMATTDVQFVSISGDLLDYESEYELAYNLTDCLKDEPSKKKNEPNKNPEKETDKKKLNGSLLVLSKILSNEFLYNEIRAKGGAYGAGISCNVSAGTFSTYSYRDPNLKKTVDVYEEIPNIIKNLDLSINDISRFIIGTVGSMDAPMTERKKGYFDLTNYLMGRDSEYYDKVLNEVLNTNLEELKSYAEIFKNASTSECLAVIGSEEAIDAEKTLFKKIASL